MEQTYKGYLIFIDLLTDGKFEYSVVRESNQSDTSDPYYNGHGIIYSMGIELTEIKAIESAKEEIDILTD